MDLVYNAEADTLKSRAVLVAQSAAKREVGGVVPGPWKTALQRALVA